MFSLFDKISKFCTIIKNINAHNIIMLLTQCSYQFINFICDIYFIIANSYIYNVHLLFLR